MILRNITTILLDTKFMALNLDVVVDERIPASSLAEKWAKKYLQSLQVDSSHQPTAKHFNVSDLSEIVSSDGRAKTAEKMLQSLRSVSAKAWNKTEMLLSGEIKVHNIDPNLINPWEVAGDVFKIYETIFQVYAQKTKLRPLSQVVKLPTESNLLPDKTAAVYTRLVSPGQLARLISADIGIIRNKYTSVDPRVIGFVSMQFHYTSQLLMQQLEPLEQVVMAPYFKIIDDHLYMPLQRAYKAAAKHNYDSLALSAVQQLLPVSTTIAKNVCESVIELYAGYNSMSGSLSHPTVKTSSIRDVEMFQVYLWVCALEGSITSIQEELFPMCVMLYPKLNVHWELIRMMLNLLGNEIQTHLTAEQAETLMPYLQVLRCMFSPEVFG
jgi:hypothetical protein